MLVSVGDENCICGYRMRDLLMMTFLMKSNSAVSWYNRVLFECPYLAFSFNYKIVKALFNCWSMTVAK